VFRQLDQKAFEQVLGQWFAAQGLQTDEALAIDGQTLRGIHGEEVPGVHLVAAFAHRTRTVLAQAATQGKGHELAGGEAILAALPARLLCGHVVSGNALLAEPSPLASDLGERGDSFFVLKEHQPLTLDAVVVSFADPWTPRERVVVGDRQGDREERRTLEASTEVVAYWCEPETGPEEEQIGGWPGLGQGCRVHREVEDVSGRRAGERSSEWA
jgi:hypothetical protein